MSAIERYRPKSVAVLLDKLITPNIVQAMAVGNRLRAKHKLFTLDWGMPHREGAVHTARQVREDMLADFRRADEVASVLGWELRWENLDRSDAYNLLSALYRRVGAKNDEETSGLIEGSIGMLLDSDEIGRASGLWKPLEVTPVALALACHKLINSKSIFKPKPQELRAACEEVMEMLLATRRLADRLVEHARKADLILLEFAPAEWARPWLTSQHRPGLARMLDLHIIHGDGTEAFDEEGHQLRGLIEWMANLEERRVKLEDATRPKLIAAKSDIKRLKKETKNG